MDFKITYKVLLVISVAVFIAAYKRDLRVTSVSRERIATREDIVSTTGVAIDFSYNETYYISSTGRSSVLGCPKSVDGRPWIYFGDPPKCFLSGIRNICQAGSTLLAVISSPFGQCVCNCLVDSTYPEELKIKSANFIECKGDTSNRNEKLTSDPGVSRYSQIYDKKKMKCFTIGYKEGCRNGVVTGLDNNSITCGEGNYSWVLSSTTFTNQNQCPHGESYNEESKTCLLNTVLADFL